VFSSQIASEYLDRRAGVLGGAAPRISFGYRPDGGHRSSARVYGASGPDGTAIAVGGASGLYLFSFHPAVASTRQQR
jgi:hypothetical protein